MSKYMLTVRLKFDAFDHLDARVRAKRMLEKVKFSKDQREVKLQEVFDNKKPEKVEL